MKDRNSFRFWLPMEIEKSSDGKPVDYADMRIKGIASTDDKDIDDEVLLNKGFDLSYFLNNGFINWHHQYKDNPSMIIGEPLDAKVTKKGLFVSGRLYDTPVARQVYDLANTLEKNSDSRRLGWSIEGKATARKGTKITKARITGVAITPAPKNTSTYAEIVKAMSDGSTTEELFGAYEEAVKEDASGSQFELETAVGTLSVGPDGSIRYVEKALAAGSGTGMQVAGKTDASGASLKREHLEGARYASHSPKLMYRIFERYPDISFAKALKLHDLIQRKVQHTRVSKTKGAK